MRPMNSMVGTQIGHYRLNRVLDAGGMAALVVCAPSALCRLLRAPAVRRRLAAASLPPSYIRIQ